MGGKRYPIAVDTGGTFTDLVALDRRNHVVRSVKVPSTPGDPACALLAALAETGLPGEQIAFFGHSTTVALNALLQRRGAPPPPLTPARLKDPPPPRPLHRPHKRT